MSEGPKRKVPRTHPPNNSPTKASSSNQKDPQKQPPKMKFNPKPSPQAANPLKIGGNKSDGLSNSAARDGVKKLVIKNAKPTRTQNNNDQFIKSAIGRLSNAIRCILSPTPQPTPESLQELYTLCETVINFNTQTCRTLYDRIRMEIERRVGVFRKNVAQGTPGEGWAQLMNNEWKAFLNQMLTVRGIFLQLDRTYILQQQDLLSLWDLSTDIIRYTILQDKAICALLTQSLNMLINEDRDGRDIDLSIVQSLLGQLSSINSTDYEKIFVQPFFEATREYYNSEGDDKITTLTPTNYIQHCMSRLQSEEARLNSTLFMASFGSFQRSLLHVIEEQLVLNHSDEILGSGLESLIDQDDFKILNQIYVLFQRSDSLELLKDNFANYIITAGTKAVLDEENDAQMIPTLLNLKTKIFNIVISSFEDSNDVRRVVVDSFRKFINSRRNKPAEMIAKFIDQRMRTGGKGMSDDEFEQELDSVLLLLRWTQGKDMFEAFYQRNFAKRLLLNRSASSDAEKSMLIKLKKELGSDFTTSLETMARDIDLSADIMKAYRAVPTSTSGKQAPFDLNVSVLTTGNWPNYEPVHVTLPTDMSQALDRFKQFYGNKYNGRSLYWQHNLDQCTLKANFPKGKKELSVSLFQTLVLLLFNDIPQDQHLSFNDIIANTKLSEEEAKRTLQSLACGKVRVLTKHPKGRDVNDTDTFTFNSQFRNDHYKLKVNAIQMKETVQEQQATEERVLLDRQSHLQLIIVRVLKSRKTIKHQELVIEVISLLKDRFKVETNEIKKAIDSLIDRDYITRKSGERGVYEYVA